MSETIKPGYYIQLIEEGRPTDFFMVMTMEPFEYYTNDSGTDEFTDSVAASGTSGWKNIVNLEPDDRPRRLYQCWVGVGQGDYAFKIPAGSDRFGIDNDKDVGTITNIKSPYFAPNEAYEMWFVHNYYPSINCINNDAANAMQPWLRFTGFKYDIELMTDPYILKRIKDGSLGCRRIVIGGVRPG